MFSTLAAITGLSLTLPPVSGSVDLGRGAGVLVGDGVDVGATEFTETELFALGAESGRLSAAATPMPPAPRTAAAAIATMVARFMNEWA
jgi:hypothetical protein